MSRRGLKPALQGPRYPGPRLMSGRGLQARATQAPADVKTRAKARATQVRDGCQVAGFSPRYPGSGGCQDAG